MEYGDISWYKPYNNWLVQGIPRSSHFCFSLPPDLPVLILETKTLHIVEGQVPGASSSENWFMVGVSEKSPKMDIPSGYLT
jgi:hypothetical protein